MFYVMCALGLWIGTLGLWTEGLTRRTNISLHASTRTAPPHTFSALHHGSVPPRTITSMHAAYPSRPRGLRG